MLKTYKTIIEKEIDYALRDTALKVTLDFSNKEEAEGYNSINEFIKELKEEVTTTIFEIIEKEKSRSTKKLEDEDPSSEGEDDEDI